MSAGVNILTEDHMIASDTAGIELHLRRKRRRDIERFSAARTLLLMHGATFPCASLFDVPVDGASLMDSLAVAGYDVHALDVRGYGGSTRPVAMDTSPEAGAPEVRTEVAVRDLGAAVDHILEAHGVDRLVLIGMSWGGSVAGAYTSTHNDKVARLVLIAPQWLAEGPTRIDAGGPLGAWRDVDVAAFHDRWLAPAPAAKRATLIPPGVFEAFAAITLASDPATTCGKIRAPNGPILDVREYWTAGRPIYDPGDIRVPVLLVHAEWDADVTIDRTLALFKHFNGAPSRRWVEIGEGTHMIVLEKNRWQFIDAVIAFLDEGRRVS